MTAITDIGAISSRGTELARYLTPDGERVLTGWRASGGIEVVDRPASGRGRGFVVDRDFGCTQQLEAFIGDYVDHARRLGRCPMGSEAIGGLVDRTEAEVAEGLLAAIGTC